MDGGQVHFFATTTLKFLNPQEELENEKSLLAALIAATLCIPAVASADDETDMAKITCKEFLSAGESEMGLMLTWIDGHMSARSDNTMMSKAWMEKLGAHMASFCSSNPGKTIMDAMNAVPSN